MNRFTDREKKLIEKLSQSPLETTLQLREACPSHSACVPLPLFRVHRVSEGDFEAQWNSFHRKGPTQVFHFSDAGIDA